MSLLTGLTKVVGRMLMTATVVESNVVRSYFINNHIAVRVVVAAGLGVLGISQPLWRDTQ